MARKTFYCNNYKQEKSCNFISFPYHPYLENIVYPLKLLGLNATFSYPNSIGIYFIRNRIPCRCGKFYVGQTCKTLGKWVSQHKYNVRSADTRSALYNHSVNCNFPINWSDAEALYRYSNFIERNVLESAYIYHTDKKF